MKGDIKMSIKISINDNDIVESESGLSAFAIARNFSPEIAKNSLVCEINGEMKDLSTPVNEDCSIKYYSFDDPKGKHAFWHTSSHVLAQAVKRLFPQALLTIGPAIENGFYYDIDSEIPFTPDVLEKIEAEMKKIVKEGLKLERFVLDKKSALDLMKDNPYKVELIENLPDGEEISFYKQGEFVDLCSGPHLFDVSKIKAIKLTQCTGAYWRADAKNKMLQRVYGISFPKADMLTEYLQALEEAKRRDHRRIGKELDIFMVDDLVGRGLPMFLPNGYIVWQELENYIRKKEYKLGYQHVLTPCVGNVELYKTSGHWDHYKDNMFPAMEVEGESFVLRPMNCPHHMMIYANKMHSYKDLPIRIGEIAHDFRYEASGSLKGIERGRHFCQNDAHLFVTPEQIKSEFKNVVDLIFDVYKDFNITNYRCVLSLRDPEDKQKYHQDDEMWNKAESELREVLNDLGIEYTEEIGEAAFYGPKLDVNVKPAVGNEITLSTCQLDFCLPAKFDLKYIDTDGVKKTPVVLHRAILGSLDRFIAYILEETEGSLPTWISPVQVKILPISEKFMEYAKEIEKKISDADIRVETDERSEKIGYKIREAQLQKVPFMLIVGEKEAESHTVSVRSRKSGDKGSMDIDQFISETLELIRSKSVD